VREDLAVDSVVAGGGDRADDVRGVNVLDVCVLERTLELLFEEGADVCQDGVAAGVSAVVQAVILQQVLRAEGEKCQAKE
jgi:hypothetical protein